jgi:hypothetical protein
MELVPIVITALEIVSAFAVITLVISYIAYKARTKNAPPRGSSSSESTPDRQGRRVNRFTQFTKEIIHIPKHHEATMKQKHSERGKPYKQKTAPADTQPEAKDPKQRRLEVIKKLPRQQEEKPQKPPVEIIRKANPLNSLGDDILNKYVDNDNQKFYSLKTGKKDQI